MGLSLVVASASWAGFILSRTVLDPGRSERLADHLLDNEEVRATITERLADAVEARIPDEVPVGRETIDAAAAAALDDPRVEDLIRDGIVQAHQNALNGIDEPVTLDASALGAAGRDAVVAQRPELDAVLPAAPELEVELPNTGLAWLGSVKDAVDRFTRIGAVISLLGISIAFLLARNRPAALRRVAYWAFAASAFWIVAAYAIPAVLERLAPSSVAIAMAAIDVFFGAMITPAIVLACLGASLLLVSLLWPLLIRRRGAASLDRGSRPPRQPAYEAHRPSFPASSAGLAAATTNPGGQRPSVTSRPPAPAGQGFQAAQPQARPVPGPPPPLDPTVTFPQIISNHSPSSPPPPPAPAGPPVPPQEPSTWTLPSDQPTQDGALPGSPEESVPLSSAWPGPLDQPAHHQPAHDQGWTIPAQPAPSYPPAQPAQPPQPAQPARPAASGWNPADGEWTDDDPEDDSTWVEGVGYVDESTRRNPLTTDPRRSDP
jgi:hypothetical protein